MADEFDIDKYLNDPKTKAALKAERDKITGGKQLGRLSRPMS
jgi:hypothetical protein